MDAEYYIKKQDEIKRLTKELIVAIEEFDKLENEHFQDTYKENLRVYRAPLFRILNDGII